MPASSRYDLYATRYPLLPLKSVVIFPHSIVTLLVGKPRSIQTVEAAMAHDHCLVVVTHRDPEIEDPQADDLHQVGTLVRISSLEPQPTGGYQVRLEGLQRPRDADGGRQAPERVQLDHDIHPVADRVPDLPEGFEPPLQPFRGDEEPASLLGIGIEGPDLHRRDPLREQALS